MPKKRFEKKKLISGEIEFKKIEDKLNQVLSLEKRQFKEENEVEDLEKRQTKNENKLEKEQLEELEKIEKEIREETKPKVLAKITYRDISKAFVGAFIALISHYLVFKGVEIAQHITYSRAIFFFLLSYFVGFVFIYATGFRRVKQKKLLYFMPIRITIIYGISLLVVFIVLSIFELMTPGLLFKQLAVLSLPAIIGACAADLIGGGEYAKQKAE